ncbi:CNH domain-containing protein [Mycena metata]|uniref:CNH domain-containing protein n=1 Tax=Mycena metata TaxID=1033252 RepID=A0AAD7IYZ2_9AGAR|nr:CNH domain-containing protein [Mycena metata]
MAMRDTTNVGFEVVDLVPFVSASLPLPTDPVLQFATKEISPVSISRVSDNVFLVCYDEFGFYIDRSGAMTRHELVTRWTLPACGFALHLPYILVFCGIHVEVWDIEPGKLVQKIQSRYRLLNRPNAGDEILSESSGRIMKMVFNRRLV